MRSTRTASTVVKGSRRARRLLAAIAMIPSFLLPIAVFAPTATGSPSEHYSRPYFGADNFPPGCVRSMAPGDPNNICHHMRTGLNALDSPKVDVLVMIPVSPTAERDMRIMRQSVEMWEGGIDYLAEEMGLSWLAQGVDFHISVDYIDPNGQGGEFTTYPIVDPEIVVIASNPVGGIGIGVDPVDFIFTDENLVPCHGVSNPLDFEYWENLPGFNSHHESRSGTYVEDCGGSEGGGSGGGGNICFAVNGAIDPSPQHLEVFNLFDLVSHEFGHCLTLGHVGDGAEGSWGVVPTNDIMAYDDDPPSLYKCVSTLDVEALAIRMSRYLDVNGDDAINGQDTLLANDQIGQGGDPFQVQHPGDHLYASGTGSPRDCPQPDLGLVPGPRTDWTPNPVQTLAPKLTVTGPADGAVSEDGTFDVAGTVEFVDVQVDPPGPVGSHDDADDDATTPITEILDMSVEVTGTHLRSTIRLEDIWRSTDLLSPTTYSMKVDGYSFSSFIRYPTDQNPRTWDDETGGYLPAGTSSWNLQEKTVTFNIPRAYLGNAGITSPYYVIGSANIGALSNAVADDRVPNTGSGVGVATSRTVGLPETPLADHINTITFEHEGGNTFYPQNSTLGTTQDIGIDPSHFFTLDLAQASDVEFNLAWSDGVGASDLDLYVTGAASSGNEGATIDNPEHFVLRNVTGSLNIQVEPYLVTDPAGSTYTLTATIHADSDGDGIRDSDDACPNEPGSPPHGCPDSDGDGVPDIYDVCPDVPGAGADGCPIAPTEFVYVYSGNVLLGTQPVDTSNGPDAFLISVQLPAGTHELQIKWENDGVVIATKSVTVTSNAP